MSYPKYESKQKNLGDHFRETAWKCMLEAGIEESKLAKELGEVDSIDSIPYITVQPLKEDPRYVSVQARQAPEPPAESPRYVSIITHLLN